MQMEVDMQKEKITVYRLVHRTELEAVDQADIITIKEAAALMNKTVAVVGGFLDNRQLPTYYPTPVSEEFPLTERRQRYTLRSAVLAKMKLDKEREGKGVVGGRKVNREDYRSNPKRRSMTAAMIAA